MGSHGWEPRLTPSGTLLFVVRRRRRAVSSSLQLLALHQRQRGCHCPPIPRLGAWGWGLGKHPQISQERGVVPNMGFQLGQHPVSTQ